MKLASVEWNITVISLQSYIPVFSSQNMRTILPLSCNHGPSIPPAIELG